MIGIKVLIDTGYLVFSTIYSVIKDKKDINESNIERLVEQFDCNMRIKLYQIMSRHKALAKDMYFIRDCPRTDIWRKKLVEGYKCENNSSYSNTMNIFFTRMYTDIIPRFCSLHRVNAIKIPNAEADDIISLFIKFSDSNCVVISNDKDLFQLIKFDNVSFFNINGRCINKKANNWCNLINFNNNELYTKVYDKQFINLNIVPYSIWEKFNTVMHNINVNR